MFIRPPSSPRSSALVAPRQRPLVRRISGAPTLADARHSFDEAIAPIGRAEGRAVGMGRSFAAQLLELGLKHNVEGLVNKASAAVEAHGAAHPTAHYELAQNNFAEAPHLLYWRV